MLLLGHMIQIMAEAAWENIDQISSVFKLMLIFAEKYKIRMESGRFWAGHLLSQFLHIALFIVKSFSVTAIYNEWERKGLEF